MFAASKFVFVKQPDQFARTRWVAWAGDSPPPEPEPEPDLLPPEPDDDD